MCTPAISVPLLCDPSHSYLLNLVSLHFLNIEIGNYCDFVQYILWGA